MSAIIIRGVTDTTPLYRTRDGGKSGVWSTSAERWSRGFARIDIVKSEAIYQGRLRERVVVHAGGRVGGPAKLLRSLDGGETWSFIDLTGRAGMILDVKFLDADTGFVFAGTDKDNAKSNALILKTSDGPQPARGLSLGPPPRSWI